MADLNDEKQWVQTWQTLAQETKDHQELINLPDLDPSAIKEIEEGTEALEKSLRSFELEYMLQSSEDKKDCILTIHPGAGGVESCDWAGMLMRMYLKWIENRKYGYRMLSLEPAEEGGIKDAAIEVQGKNAYGYLKAETGVHRLVRLSPFDANNRRHTSFASVFVYPEMEEIEVKITPEDLKIETFRASGHGGQNVNKVASAVRLIHIPSGVMAQCQNERSQSINKAYAMKILYARIYQYYKEKEEEKNKALEDTKTDIAWGHQIRSYVFHPYKLIKDHRTDVETGNVDKVMDGDLDEFIEAYLLLETSRKKNPK